MTERVTGARAVAYLLQQEGVRHVFHLPGSQIIDILDELYQSPIRTVLTRHEQGAAFMADGYARAVRGLGVCMSTVGPGAMNLVSGLAASFKAGVPVLAVTGIHDHHILELDSFHEMDRVGVFAPITKWSACVHQPEKIPDMFRKAFRLALSGRPGPVHLAIPSDVSQGWLDFEPLAPERYRTMASPAAPPGTAARIADQLEKASFPVLLAGGDVLWDRAVSDAAALAETLEIPAVTTRDTMGAFPSSHHLGAGLIGRGRGEAGNALIKKADLILALGVKFDYQTTRYNHDLIPASARMVHVSSNVEEVGRIYPVDVGAVCGVKSLIRELLAEARRRGLRFDLGQAVRQAKEEASRKLETEVRPDRSPLQPQAIARALRRFLPPETVVAVDGGNFAKHVRRHFEILRPDSFHYPDDFGSVGSAFPLALGVKAAQPDRPVACFNGDGAFLLNSQELETAVREKLGVKVFVFNDFGFGNVRAYQKNKFAGRYQCDFGNPPFDRLAELFGAQGARVETMEQLERAAAQALETEGPFVVDIMMSPEELGQPGFMDGPVAIAGPPALRP